MDGLESRKYQNHCSRLLTPAMALVPYFALGLSNGRVDAQPPIVPAQDGLNTQVLPQGDRTVIQGGQLSGDRGNLFHGFERFDVPTGHTADFRVMPQLRNILGRISGGEPSLIDGTIQGSGGTPNLFLLNPAGAVFGPNSQLNVPASFHFSTADQVQFGSGFGWDVFGVGDISATALNGWNGDPTGFGFGAPASLVNFGSLVVVPGADLTLMGGTVLNRGSLSAPGGTVTLAAVEPGMVQLSRGDGLLNLEFQAAAIAPTGITRQTLPELLTGSDLAVQAAANTVAVDNATGAVTLGRTRVATEGGTAIAGGSVSASSATGVGGTVNVLGDRVAVAGGTITATGPEGGGLLQVGGGFMGQGLVWNAQNTSVDSVSAFDVSATQMGPGGTAIAWADGNTWFEGTAIARGGPFGGNGGLVETSGLVYLDASRAIVDAGATLGSPGTWLLDPGSLTVASAGESNISTTIGPLGETEYIATGDPAAILDSTIEATLNAGTDVTLESDDRITVAVPINKTAGGDATLRLFSNAISIDASITATAEALSVDLSADNTIEIGAGVQVATNGGDVTLAGNRVVGQSAAQIITTGGNVDINVGIGGLELTGTSISTNSGNITVNENNPNGGPLSFQSGTRLETGTGNIVLTGASIPFSPSLPLGESAPIGLTLEGANLKTGTGEIRLTGTGGSELPALPGLEPIASNSNGIEISGATQIESGGLISIVGTGQQVMDGNSRANQGVVIDGVTIAATGAGAIAIQGTAGNITRTDDAGNGVEIAAGTTLSVEDGTLTITGNGTGIGDDTGHGIDIAGALTATGTGNIMLTGNGSTGAGESNHGIFLREGAVVQVADGTATLTGTALGTGDFNSGVVLELAAAIPTRAEISATGTGNIILEGVRGNGNTGNNDVFLGGAVSTQGGTVTIRNGTGGTTIPRTGEFNDGIVISGVAGLVRTNGGAIEITGTSASGGSLSQGILVENPESGGIPLPDTVIVALNGGTVTLNGTTRGTDADNGGIEIAGQLALGDGATATITGTSLTGSGNAAGIVSRDTSRIMATGTGTFTFIGEGNSTGVNLQGAVSTVDGDLTITGDGGISGVQIENTVETTGAGALRVTGTATQANGNGITVTNAAAAVARATGTGDAIFQATGMGTGIDFNVPEAGSSANTGLYSLTTEQNLAFSGDRTFTGDVFLRSVTGDVTVAGLSSSQGALELVSDAGNINHQALNGATTISLTANQGAIAGTSITAGGTTTVRALNEILMTGAVESAGYDARSEGDRFEGLAINSTGPVTVSANGDVTVGTVTAPGFAIQLESRAGQLTAGDISTTAATGGDITVIAETQITSGALNARGTTGNGGDVFVDPVGDIEIPWIDASGGSTGIGGNVFVETTGGNLRFTGVTPNAGCSGASVCTTSGSRVDLRHGSASPTFEVGDPSTNGSAGTLTNGVDTIATGLSLLSTPSTSFGEGGVSVMPGEIPGVMTMVPPPRPVTPVVASVPVTPTAPAPALPVGGTTPALVETPLDIAITPTAVAQGVGAIAQGSTSSANSTNTQLSLELGDALQQQRNRDGIVLDEAALDELLPKSADRTDVVSVNFARQIQASLKQGDIPGAIAATDALRRYEFAVHFQDEVQQSVRTVDKDLILRAQKLLQTW
ncbi:MAG: filamentous hemagglutinin N-terminal domain-containing protein, partial [Cyanobacteria bacterium P01_H01_bin.130]